MKLCVWQRLRNQKEVSLVSCQCITSGICLPTFIPRGQLSMQSSTVMSWDMRMQGTCLHWSFTMHHPPYWTPNTPVTFSIKSVQYIPLYKVGLQWQQIKQSIPDVLLPRNTFQILSIALFKFGPPKGYITTARDPMPDVHLPRIVMCCNADCINCDLPVQYCNFCLCITSAAVFHKVNEKNWKATEAQCRQE